MRYLRGMSTQHQPVEKNKVRISTGQQCLENTNCHFHILKICYLKFKLQVQHLPASMRRDFLQRRLLRSNPYHICQTCIRNHLHFHRHPTNSFVLFCLHQWILSQFFFPLGLFTSNVSKPESAITTVIKCVLFIAIRIAVRKWIHPFCLLFTPSPLAQC